ncbi:DUF559 domain-containing protein [Actinotalea sp. K2]|uniref:DUF559 domain-containing protein n=1 Tax=Actinotalea sp. K2 TaxID=2939438 RepID=UPI0020175660|nr:DUF559 domain-containing protein [Actinotalea sp. K2]
MANGQSSVFTAAQALSAGMTIGQVRHRRSTRLWVPVAGSALRHRDLDARRDPMVPVWAACLTWPDAVVCRRAAARVHGLPVDLTGRVHAIVPHGRRARARLEPLRVALPEDDVLRFAGFALTTLPRTVLDLLGHLPERESESLLVWVLTRRVLTHAHLERLLSERPGLAGNVRRRALLATTRGGAMSLAERRLHTILERGGVAGWQADQTLRDDTGIIGNADVLFRAEKLVLEVDGQAYHQGAQFQRDRTRQNRLVAAGFTVLRFTWHDLTDRPNTVLHTVTRTRLRAHTIR